MNLIFTSVIVVVVCVFQQCCCQCPPNTQYGKSCYIIPEAEANWIGAVRYCKALGANLASLDTKEENDFVLALINSTNKSRRLTFNTPDQYTYQYLEQSGVAVVGHTSVTFKVQACNDAHLALSATTDSTRDTYEIVLGGWSDSESVIRDCMQCSHQDEVREDDHPLDCADSRPFWLSWQDGHIQVGRGQTVGEDQFLEWEDPNPHDVNHLGIATGWGATGVWNFHVETYPTGVFWLGVTDLLVEGEWARLPDLEEIEFTAWARNQPSSGTGRHCAALDSARDLGWIDADCEFRRNFVCEKYI